MRLAVLAFALSGLSASAAELHYAPAENLERIDVETLSRAGKTIDIAAYVLTDWPVIDALTEAGQRGVAVRIYLDGGQAGHLDPAGPFGRLLDAPNVVIKQKHPGRPIMHFKSYCVDRRAFRTGSANFSASGLKRQDNDLLLFDDPAMCAKFEADFDAIWSGVDAE